MLQFQKSSSASQSIKSRIYFYYGVKEEPEVLSSKFGGKIGQVRGKTQ
jgi:hypothetical protein